jgi:hypothetical protein
MYRNVTLGGKFRFGVKASLLEDQLPNIYSTYCPAISLDRLSCSVSNISSGRLSPSSALGPLQWFFYAGQNYSYKSQIPREVANHLNDLANRGEAIHKIRKHFTTLAYLSSRGASTTIPPYLLDFFSDYMDDIIDMDDRHLDDWEHAIGKLKNLAPTSGLLKRFASRRNNHPRYQTQFRRPCSHSYGSGSNHYDSGRTDSWDRGRHLNRANPRHRAQTMPPICYAVPQIAAPTYLPLPVSRGIMSGFPSPSLFAQDPWREAEMDEIREHQMYLAEQVNQLALGQQALEEEVDVQQVGGFAPRMIGYH